MFLSLVCRASVFGPCSVMQYLLFFSSFAIIPLGKRGLVNLLLCYFECHISVVILCLFLTVPWNGLDV